MHIIIYHVSLILSLDVLIFLCPNGKSFTMRDDVMKSMKLSNFNGYILCRISFLS